MSADGSFLLDSLPAGAYTLALEHPAYSALGMLAAEQDLEVAENSASLTALQALGTDQVLRRLCGYPQSGDDRAAARVVVRTADGAGAPGVEVNVRSESFFMDTPGLLGRRPITDKVRTDSLGVAMFCELQARRPLHFDLMLPGEREATRQVHTLPPHSIAVITFKP